MSSNDDDKLPWQVTLLAFVWFGGLLVAGLLKLAWGPGWFPAEIRAQIRGFAYFYLIATAVLTPILLISAYWKRR